MDQDNSNLKTDPSFAWIDKLYQEHGKFIESVIHFSARNNQESDDIYQEVFLALMNKKEPKDIGDIRSYLYILTLNKVSEYRQKQARGKQIIKNYADFMASVTLETVDNPALVYEEADRMLETIKTCLSEKESEAVLLRYRHMAENEQAAKMMNVSKSTFLRYVSVGVKKIRAIVRSDRADK
jgi:RNA polymerase sigma factor (sigma-70 family)